MAEKPLERVAFLVYTVVGDYRHIESVDGIYGQRGWVSTALGEPYAVASVIYEYEEKTSAGRLEQMHNNAYDWREDDYLARETPQDNPMHDIYAKKASAAAKQFQEDLRAYNEIINGNAESN